VVGAGVKGVRTGGHAGLVVATSERCGGRIVGIHVDRDGVFTWTAVCRAGREDVVGVVGGCANVEGGRGQWVACRKRALCGG
jgi:hypothetical protein